MVSKWSVPFAQVFFNGFGYGSLNYSQAQSTNMIFSIKGRKIPGTLETQEDDIRENHFEPFWPCWFDVEILWNKNLHLSLKQTYDRKLFLSMSQPNPRQDLLQHELKPSDVTYVSLLKALNQANQLGRSLTMLKERQFFAGDRMIQTPSTTKIYNVWLDCRLHIVEAWNQTRVCSRDIPLIHRLQVYVQ